MPCSVKMLFHDNRIGSKGIILVFDYQVGLHVCKLGEGSTNFMISAVVHQRTAGRGAKLSPSWTIDARRLRYAPVSKMTSHAIFQYIVLTIDDTHNTWTNMIVKMNIRRLLGSSDDKEKRGVARPEGPPLRGFRPSRVSGQRPESSSVQGTRFEAFCYHRLNRRRAK